MDLSNLIKDGWKQYKDYPVPNYPEYGSYARTSIFTILKFYGEYEVHISIHPKGNDKFDVVSCTEHRCTDPCTNIESQDIEANKIQALIAECCEEWDKHFA